MGISPFGSATAPPHKMQADKNWGSKRTPKEDKGTTIASYRFGHAGSRARGGLSFGPPRAPGAAWSAGLGFLLRVWGHRISCIFFAPKHRNQNTSGLKFTQLCCRTEKANDCNLDPLSGRNSTSKATSADRSAIAALLRLAMEI